MNVRFYFPSLCSMQIARRNKEVNIHYYLLLCRGNIVTAVIDIVGFYASYFCPTVTKLSISQEIIVTYNISRKSLEWNRFVPFGRTNMTKLLVAFRNCAIALER